MFKSPLSSMHFVCRCVHGVTLLSGKTNELWVYKRDGYLNDYQSYGEDIRAYSWQSVVCRCTTYWIWSFWDADWGLHGRHPCSLQDYTKDDLRKHNDSFVSVIMVTCFSQSKILEHSFGFGRLWRNLGQELTDSYQIVPSLYVYWLQVSIAAAITLDIVAHPLVLAVLVIFFTVPICYHRSELDGGKASRPDTHKRSLHALSLQYSSMLCQILRIRMFFVWYGVYLMEDMSGDCALKKDHWQQVISS